MASRRRSEVRALRARLRSVALAGLAALVAGGLAAPAAPAAGPPQLLATWASAVGSGNAVVNAELNPNGLLTTARFQYIGAAAYRSNVEANPPRDGFTGAVSVPAGPVVVGSGTAAVSFSQQLNGLAAGSGYRYRIVAGNEAGGATGPAVTFTTAGRPVPFVLPDGRGWEMVSPVDKNGGAIEPPEALFGGGAIQAAAQGGAVTYSSAASFGEGASSPGASQYVSSRGAGGWGTENVTAPSVSGGYPAGPQSGVPYRLFSPDLARAVLSNGQRCRGEAGQCPVANPPLPGSGAPAGYRNYYLREVGGFRALLGATQLGSVSSDRFEVVLVAASPDLGQLVLSSCTALTADAVEAPAPGGGCEESEPNLYLWSAGQLRALNLLPGETATTPGATVAATGTVAADGRRVYWSNGEELFLREGVATVRLDGGLGGAAQFQAAATDGHRVYFTEAGHLFAFDAPDAVVTDLTPGGGVTGVLGASADGSTVYYQAASGLFAWHDGIAVQVAPGADAASPGDFPPATGSARVSADGSRLLFLSTASLSGYDNHGASEVFLYGPPAGGGATQLRCLSCNPTGARPLGPSTIPGAVANGSALRAYKPRALSADGTRAFFDSADALVPQDTNAAPDVYEWEDRGVGSCQAAGGCLALISSGRSEGGASFLDASADGDDAFFLTAGSLVAEDPGSADVYDARIGGGFPVPPAPVPCFGDACQPVPAEPEDPTPGTMFLRPEGNPPLSFGKGDAGPKPRAKPKRSGKKKSSRHGKRAGGRRSGGSRTSGGQRGAR